MSKIISIHSFRGGTGKSNTTANLAALAAQQGLRVGVVDTDIQSPGIQVLFGLEVESIKYALNDYLWGKCEIERAAYKVKPEIGEAFEEDIYLIPSSIKAGDIARVLQDGYDVNLLREGFRQLIKALSLDLLIIDTHPGLNEETLLSIALSNTLAILLRPDKQDYLGTGVTVEVSRHLEVPRMLLIMNKVPEGFDSREIVDRVKETYACDVAGVIPHSEKLMSLGSSELYVLKYPEDPVTREFKKILSSLID